MDPRVCTYLYVQVLAHGSCGYLSILQATRGGSLNNLKDTLYSFSLPDSLALCLHSADQAWMVTTACQTSLFLTTQHPGSTRSLSVLRLTLPGQDGSQPPNVATEPWKHVARPHFDI